MKRNESYIIDAGDRRDPEISGRLKAYTSELNAPRGVLEKAKLEIRTLKKRRSRNFAAGFSAVAAILIVVIFSINYFASLQNTDNPPSVNPPVIKTNYKLSELKRRNTDISEFSNLAFIRENSCVEVKDIKKFVYDGIDYCVSVEYIILRDGGAEKFMLIADLRQGLQDYKDFQEFGLKDGLRQYSIYKNGEYYSYGYLQESDADYYLILMSNANTNLSYYASLMLKA